MIQLTRIGIGSKALPDRLIWTDEHNWQPVAQETAYSADGFLLVDVAKKRAGRTITLDGSNTEAWMTRAEVEALRAWAAEPGETFRLFLRGQTFTVIFAHDDEPIKAELVLTLNDDDIGDAVYRVSFKFLEV